jgi:hypothetical protein
VLSFRTINLPQCIKYYLNYTRKRFICTICNVTGLLSEGYMYIAGLTETGDDESEVAGNVGSHVIR